jgi:hypothetical protein
MRDSWFSSIASRISKFTTHRGVRRRASTKGKQHYDRPAKEITTAKLFLVTVCLHTLSTVFYLAFVAKHNLSAIVQSQPAHLVSIPAFTIEGRNESPDMR